MRSCIFALALTSVLYSGPHSIHCDAKPGQNTNRAKYMAGSNNSPSQPSRLGLLQFPSQQTNEKASDVKTSAQGSIANTLTVLFTGILAAMAILQSIVFGVQAKRLRETVEKMDEIAEEQTSDMGRYIEQASRAALAMEGVAKELSISSKAASGTLEMMKGRTATQLRAFVTVSIGNGVPQNRANNQPFFVSPVVSNDGQTPAYKLRYTMKVDVLPNPVPANYQFPEVHPAGGESILGPHQHLVLVAGTAMESYVPDQDVLAIMQLFAARAIYAWGTVWYEDIFGEKHHTEFNHLMQWFPNGSPFGIYTPGYNKAD